MHHISFWIESSDPNIEETRKLFLGFQILSQSLKEAGPCLLIRFLESPPDLFSGDIPHRIGLCRRPCRTLLFSLLDGFDCLVFLWEHQTEGFPWKSRTGLYKYWIKARVYQSTYRRMLFPFLPPQEYTRAGRLGYQLLLLQGSQSRK